MKRTKSLRVVAALLAISAMTIAACGNSGEASETSSSASGETSSSSAAADSSATPEPAGESTAEESSAASEETSAEAPLEPLDLRIAMTSSAGNLAPWVADEMGFFKDAGLNVSLEVIGTTVSEQVPQLLGRQFDIASMTPPALITSASVGLGTGVVAASYKIGKDDEITLVVASPDSGIKTPEDLVGKRLAAPSIAGNVNTGTMYWLTTLGIDPKSVDVVAASTPNMPDLLRSGQIDAAELTMPYVGMMMGEGYTVVGNPLPAVSDPVQMSAWCANVEWANNNPEAIKRFRQALQTTVDWIAENPEKAIDILFEKTKVPAEYKPFMNLPDYDIAITAADLDAWINAMNVVSGFTSELPTEQMVVG